MTKPTIQWYWRIDRRHLYAKLGSLGGMADQANTHIHPWFSWQGKLSLLLGYPGKLTPYPFEVRVIQSPAFQRAAANNPGPGNYKHRIHVRCLKCHAWQPFGRLHQHVGSLRCQATAEIASKLPAIPSLRSARP